MEGQESHRLRVFGTRSATSGDSGASAGKPVAVDGKSATTRTRAATGGKKAKDLDALRGPVVEAQKRVEAAKKEAKRLQAKAHDVVGDAKAAYRVALTVYRDACRKAGQKCEFSGGRAANVSERVSFLVVKVDTGLKVTVKGRPETEEVIPKAKLKVSIGKAAIHYTEKHLGPKSEIGNKQGSLGNRLRAALKK